jgi:tRNA nucleotidyltransferase (CCA-adding enzyme)
LTDAMDRICSRVAKQVNPSKEERDRVRRLLEKFTSKARHEANARGLEVRVEVEGSIAKDTWIGSDRDLDIFLIFPPGTEAEAVKREGLKLAKASAGARWSLGYAEHPYVEAEMDGFTLDIVPSAEMRKGERPTTSVDRTPLHTRFVSERLDADGRTQVRILKQFLKGIGAYGAELRVGGFSGYIAELLIIHLGSFKALIEAAAGWGGRTCIDIAGHYAGRNPGDIFEGNLVIVDPVDMSRNAAAAVSSQSYFTFIAASRQFLEKASIKFFYPLKIHAESEMVLRALERKGSHLVAVVMSCPRVPSDILWGEAYRTMRRIAAILDEGGFEVNDSAAWSDEKDLLAFIFELHGLEINPVRLHFGPMVTLAQEAGRFLEKYISKKDVLAGPYIKGERWVVEIKRGHDTALSLLAAELKGARFSKDVERELKKEYRVLVDDQMKELMAERQGLADLALQLLRKRPPWLSR